MAFRGLSGGCRGSSSPDATVPEEVLQLLFGLQDIGVPKSLGALAGGAAAEAVGPRGALLGAVAVLLSGTVAAWLSPLRTAAPEA